MTAITAFEGVSVIPLDEPRTDNDRTAIVEGDRITWIGPRDTAEIPAGAARINGRERFLVPGLADMHAHPSFEGDLLLFVAHGVTTVRNLWGMPRHVLWRERIVRGELLGPTIHTTGPIVDGRPVRNPWSTSVVTAAEAERAVQATRRGGYDALKVYDQLTPEAYGWLTAAARDHGLPVVGHVPFRVGLPGALDAGQRSIEHLYGYLHALRPEPVGPDEWPDTAAQMRAALLESATLARDDRIAEVAEATRAAGTWNCPTLLIRQRWIQDAEELLRRPEMRYVAPAEADRWRRFAAGYPRHAAADRVHELNLALTKALRDAGAGLLVGTDAGIPLVLAGASVHEELAAFVEAGLTPYEALRSATADAAAFLGEPGEWGAVAVGSRADLVLLDANPLLDIANTTLIAGVMVRGRWHSADDLRSRCDELAAERATPRPPVLDDRAAGSTRARYQLERAGAIVGVEDVTIERSDNGQRMTTRSEIGRIGSGFTVGVAEGSYHSEVDVGPDGADRAARFEHDGLDGRHEVSLTRGPGGVRVRVTDPVAGGHEEWVELPDAGLLSRPLTGLYARLTPQLSALAVGETAEVPVFGPGLPPDLTTGPGVVRAERLRAAAGRDTTRRFSFELVRANVRFSGVVVTDSDGRLIEVELEDESPVMVRLEPGSNP